MPPIRANLTLEPEDAVDFFRTKGEVISWDYTDTWRDANVRAFTVAKATSLDVLRTIRAEVDKSLSSGQTFDAFKRALRPRLEELGWWGRKELTDGDTGEVSTVQLGSVRRLRTIFQTNVQTSYMAGRYKQLLGNVRDRPYWRYVAVMDGRTRPEHAALNGKVWRWDDPIWAVIWPPNGWGCRCRVTALTEREFQALGVPLENGTDAIVNLQVPVGKEGKLVDVQGVRFLDGQGREKVFRPDPGWDYNPGAAWATFDPVNFERTQRPLTLLPGQQTAQQLGTPPMQSPVQPPQLLPAAGMDAQAASAAIRQALLQGQPQRVLQTPLGPLALRPELLPDVSQAASMAGSEWWRWAPMVPQALQSPGEVWLQAWSDGTYRTRHLQAYQLQGRLVVLAIREARDSSLVWEVLDGALAELLRVGVLLYRRSE